MHRFFKPISDGSSSSTKRCVEVDLPESPCNPNLSSVDFELLELPSDPGKRLKITDYDLKICERVRRKYYLEGPCQPRLDEFPKTNFNGKLRRFNKMWYDEFKWLEYSVCKNAAYCLYCYLFKNESGHQGGGDTFVNEGFTDWKNKDKLRKHEGGKNSAHNQALSKCQDLLNEKQHIKNIIHKKSKETKIEYQVRLKATINCIRWLLKQGLAFRGNDESENSKNKGNFIELLQFLSDHNEDVRRVVLTNAPKNCKLITHCIQKDIVRACAYHTTDAIMKELDGAYFSVLLDESRDVSMKEQMAVVLRFVNKKGCIVERLLGFKHVSSTTSLSLKCALEDLLSSNGLSISMLRGQGYDGASNMRGEFNGLQAHILKENKCAYYVHCFAHQLQLALVAVAKNHIRIASLFLCVSNIVNIVGGSCKRQDLLREKQAKNLIEALENKEIVTGRGLNQERTLVRPSDTRWGSHYGTLMSLIHMFDSAIEVIDAIVEDGKVSEQKALALNLLRDMQMFEFVFNLHLMKKILGITNDLSQALQRKDQDIVNAIALVRISKSRLQEMREEGWDSLVGEVSDFCACRDIDIPCMDDFFVAEKRPKRRAEKITNLHHYKFELFNTVIDMQLQELNSRFSEVSSELLLCVACFDPSNSFSAFDVQKLTKLAKFYPKDFSVIERLALPEQLENFIWDMRGNFTSFEFHNLGDVSLKLVETKKNEAYPLVYRLLTLAMILPVATASVERAFSSMKIVKSRLRNRMGDAFMNDCLVVYIEKDIFLHVPVEVIMHTFQSMDERRGAHFGS